MTRRYTNNDRAAEYGRSLPSRVLPVSQVPEEDDTKHIIEALIKQSNLKDLIKEGRDSYKKAKADGSLDNAKKNPKCPGCGVDVKPGQKFCSNCGTALM